MDGTTYLRKSCTETRYLQRSKRSEEEEEEFLTKNEAPPPFPWPCGLWLHRSTNEFYPNFIILSHIR